MVSQRPGGFEDIVDGRAYMVKAVKARRLTLMIGSSRLEGLRKGAWEEI